MLAVILTAGATAIFFAVNLVTLWLDARDEDKVRRWQELRSVLCRNARQRFLDSLPDARI